MALEQGTSCSLRYGHLSGAAHLPSRLRGAHQLQASMQEPRRPHSSLAMPAQRQPSLLQPIVWVQPSWFEAAQAGGSLCSLLRARSTAWGGFPSTTPLFPSQPIPPSTGCGTVLVPSGVPSPPPCAAPTVGCGGQRRGAGLVCGMQLLAAAVPWWGRELVTAARRERLPSAPRLLGEPSTKQTLLWCWGDSQGDLSLDRSSYTWPGCRAGRDRAGSPWGWMGGR